MVGVVFVFSIVSAQLPYCACGILCFHGGNSSVEESAAVAAEVESCCTASDSHSGSTTAKAYALQQVKSSDCCEGGGTCECTVRVRAFDDNSPAALAPVVAHSIDVNSALVAPELNAYYISPLLGTREISHWQPLRGQPYVERPFFAVNSHYII